MQALSKAIDSEAGRTDRLRFIEGCSGEETGRKMRLHPEKVKPKSNLHPPLANTW